MTDMEDKNGDAQGEACAAQESPQQEPDYAAQVAELEKQLADMKDKVLRAIADSENTRRRAQKDREETSKYAIANFAKEMLTVSDNFRRALDAAPAENLDEPMKNLIAGIDATERQFLAALERFGIKKMDVLGQPFDPHFHRVMMEVAADGQPAGTIVQVIQQGYMIHDRLLREALVAVARSDDKIVPHVDTSA